MITVLFKSPLERKRNLDQVKVVSAMVQTKLSFTGLKANHKVVLITGQGKNVVCANDKVSSR